MVNPSTTPKRGGWFLAQALFLALLPVALLLSGCPPPRMAVKPGGEATPVATAVNGPKAPALVDLKQPVSDQDYQQSLSQTANGEADSRNAEAFSTVAQYQYNHSNLDDALRAYQKVLMAGNAVSQPDRVQYMVGQIYYEKQNFLPALSAFQKVLVKFPKSNFAPQSRAMMEFILAYSLSLDDLRSYVENYPDSPLHCSALFQLGSHEAQGGLQSEAIDHLNRFLQDCPQDPSATAAQILLQAQQAQAQGKSWKIGVLIPRTGVLKGFGESVLDGITLAVEQANKSGGSNKHMSIEVKDTGSGDSEGSGSQPSEGVKSVLMFQDLLKEGDLDAVIGPVVPSEIPAVAALANERRIPLICPAFSRDGLSRLGSDIFCNSMTNEMQGRAAAKFAVEHLGLKSFAILSPDDSYGQTLADAFKKKAESMGATVVQWEAYAKGSTDFKSQLVSLGGQDPEACKENDRQNERNLETLKYNISKEIGKIFLKAKDMATASGVQAGATPVAAYVPMVEGLSNTICPSVVKDVDGAVREALKEHPDYVLRTDDLVKQAMTSLPIELKGTTLTATADQWNDVAEGLQASLLITGHIVEPSPQNDWTSYAYWDYHVDFEAFWVDPQKGVLQKIYQSKLPYSLSKPCSMVRGNYGYQALYLPAHTAEIPLLVSQIHFYDLNPVLLGGHYWYSDSILQDAAKDVEGAYFVPGFFPDSQQDPAKKFAGDYLNKFAKKPDLMAAQSYDAARLLLQAANLSSTREDIQANLLKIKDFDGVSGKTSFDGHGEAEKLLPILQIKGGKFQQVQ